MGLIIYQIIYLDIISKRGVGLIIYQIIYLGIISQRMGGVGLLIYLIIYLGIISKRGVGLTIYVDTISASGLGPAVGERRAPPLPKVQGAPAGSGHGLPSVLEEGGAWLQPAGRPLLV